MTLSMETVAWGVEFMCKGVGLGIVLGLVFPLVASGLCSVVHTISKVMNGGR